MLANCIYKYNDYYHHIQNEYKHLLLDQNFILNKIRQISKYMQDDLVFREISSDNDWKELGLFRLKNYSYKKPYMLNELNEQGLDNQDILGTVYAAWLNNEIIACIRLCKPPFELNSLLSEETLHHFLGDNYKNEYLEWTRLLIQSQHPIPGLLPALITYAGIKTLAKQAQHKYFGYSTCIVKRLFSRFQLSNQSLQFTIPKRGNHTYNLFKGDFAFDFLNVIVKPNKE